MTAASELSLSLNGFRLAAQQWDGDGLPILALHGWLDNAASFTPLAPLLEQPLCALDQAGHGASDHRPPVQMLHLVDYIADAHAALASLGWSRCILMGHSMGAGIATLLAAACPERFAALVLLDGLGPMASPASELTSTLRKALDEHQQPVRPLTAQYRDLDEAVAARRRFDPTLSDASAALLCERNLVAVDGGLAWRSDPRLRGTSAVRLTEPQVEAALSALTMPTLLVWAQQGLRQRTGMAERVTLLPDATEVEVAGHHHVHMDSPQPVAAAIRSFLAARL